MDKECLELNQETQLFLALTIIAFILTALMISLRLYTRFCIARPFGWDDASILVSYAISIATCGIAWHLIAIGIGRPLACLAPVTIVMIRKYMLISESACLISMMFSRVSVVLFVIRIFGVNKYLRRFLYVWTAYMVVQQSLSALLVYAYCRPVAGAWDPAVAKAGRCWSMESEANLRLFNGTTSVLSDLILALLPAYFLYKLQMPVGKRLALVALLALGLIPAGCAVGRVIMLERSAVSNDPYDSVTLFIFGGLEMYLLLNCATMPTLVPLYSKIQNRKKNTTVVEQITSTSSTKENSGSVGTPKHYEFIQLTESSSDG